MNSREGLSPLSIAVFALLIVKGKGNIEAAVTRISLLEHNKARTIRSRNTSTIKGNKYWIRMFLEQQQHSLSNIQVRKTAIINA